MTTMNFIRTAEGWGLASAVSHGSAHAGNKKRSDRAARASHRGELPTVGDFVIPAPVRLAQRVANAAMVRDVAALGAVILFATMVAVLLGLGEPGV